MVILGLFIGLVLGILLQAWIEHTRGDQYEKAATIAGRFQAALEAGEHRARLRDIERNKIG